MRNFRNILVLGCAAVSLAACGGDTAPQTVGSLPAPGGSGGTGGASGGSGGGVSGGSGGGTVTPTPTQSNFLAVSETTTFDAVGSFQALDKDYNTTRQTAGASLYTGNASTVNAPSGTITFDPRTGIFNLKIADSAAGVTRTINFQDPAHRTEFTPAEFQAKQVPNLTNFNYLEVFDGTTNPIFFYQRPGTSTTFVSLGGFSRSATSTSTSGTDTITNFKGERGVFVFGQKTPTGQVPITGEADFTGGFIASMVSDRSNGASSYLQWITDNGTSNVHVNFATGKVDLAVSGVVGRVFQQGGPVDPLLVSVPEGSTFKAAGTANIDLVRFGGFRGGFILNTADNPNTTAREDQSVGFTLANGTFLGVDFASVAAGGATAGASTIDGAFFGPGGINLGGNFRIIGGVPNQRVDIMGAFTGAKK